MGEGGKHRRSRPARLLSCFQLGMWSIRSMAAPAACMYSYLGGLLLLSYKFARSLV